MESLDNLTKKIADLKLVNTLGLDRLTDMELKIENLLKENQDLKSLINVLEQNSKNLLKIALKLAENKER